MDSERSFRILQLLVKADYQSEFLTLVSKSDDEIQFKTKTSPYTVVNKNNNIEIITEIILSIAEEFLFLTGNIDKIKHIEELLSSPTYVGYKIRSSSDSCYFRKYEKMYELYVYGIDHTPLQVTCTDESDTTECEFEDFVNLILHTTNVKSARN